MTLGGFCTCLLPTEKIKYSSSTVWQNSLVSVQEINDVKVI